MKEGWPRVIIEYPCKTFSKRREMEANVTDMFIQF